MARTMRTTTWRRLAAITTTAAAMLAMAASAAAPAHALSPLPDYQCTFADSAPTYRGWATLSYRGCPIPGMAQTADCRGDVAWRWTGRAWTQQQVGECGQFPTRVYVYPYTAGWSWIWTQQSGWLAIRSNLVLVHAGHVSYPTAAH